MSEPITPAVVPASGFVLSETLYARLRWVAQILLPAVGTLYFALSAIWGLPAADQVVGTIVAVDAFLGVLLGISTRSYNASDAKYSGVIDLVPNSAEETTDVKFTIDPNKFGTEGDAIFKVNQLPPQ